MRSWYNVLDVQTFINGKTITQPEILLALTEEERKHVTRAIQTRMGNFFLSVREHFLTTSAFFR
jgi:hypothetical protein